MLINHEKGQFASQPYSPDDTLEKGQLSGAASFRQLKQTQMQYSGPRVRKQG
jgi:hypothetical protein